MLYIANNNNNNLLHYEMYISENVARFSQRLAKLKTKPK